MRCKCLFSTSICIEKLGNLIQIVKKCKALKEPSVRQLLTNRTFNLLLIKRIVKTMICHQVKSDFKDTSHSVRRVN